MRRFALLGFLLVICNVLFLGFATDTQATAESCSCSVYARDQGRSFWCNQPNYNNTMFRLISCNSQRTDGLPPPGPAYACQNTGFTIGSWQSAEGAIDTTIYSNPGPPYCWNSDSISTGGCGPKPAGCDQGFVGVPGYGIPAECLQYVNQSNCALIPCTCRQFYTYRGCNPCGTNPVCTASEDSICHFAHYGNSCLLTPCNCKAQCHCATSACPTATPMPTPYCTLNCFGQAGFGGGLGNPGSGGLGGTTTPAPTILPPLITGTIGFEAYNGFTCGTFKDGKWYDGPCPTGTGTGSGFGKTSEWSYNAKYNMLCGGSPHTYTASVDDAVGESGGSGGIESTPTTGPSPTPNRYPLGCGAGGGSTPTPTTSGGVGGGQGSSTPTSCSCSVTLSCQTTLASSPNASGTGCTSTCNFSVYPEYPIYNDQPTFQTTDNTPQTNITFDFDDGTTSISDQSSISHRFVNAGIYDTTLSCTDTAESCTRRVNVYCNNGVVPTATPTPSPTAGAWFKIKDADFYKEGGILNIIPESINTDPDDDGDPPCTENDPNDVRCMNVNEAGIITSNQTINSGTAPLSKRNWKVQNYTAKKIFNPEVFLEYVKAKKKYVKITSQDAIINKELIQQGKINLIEGGPYQIQSDNYNGKTPFVLIVDGDLTLNTNNVFNNQKNPLAIIVTGKLNITEDLTELNGIFAATTIDFASDIAAGSTTQNPLKIIGNLIVDTPTNTINKRSPADPGQVPVYIVFGLEHHIRLLPFLSNSAYVWNEVAP